MGCVYIYIEKSISNIFRLWLCANSKLIAFSTLLHLIFTTPFVVSLKLEIASNLLKAIQLVSGSMRLQPGDQETESKSTS